MNNEINKYIEIILDTNDGPVSTYVAIYRALCQSKKCDKNSLDYIASALLESMKILSDNENYIDSSEM